MAHLRTILLIIFMRMYKMVFSVYRKWSDSHHFSVNRLIYSHFHSSISSNKQPHSRQKSNFHCIHILSTGFHWNWANTSIFRVRQRMGILSSRRNAKRAWFEVWNVAGGRCLYIANTTRFQTAAAAGQQKSYIGQLNATTSQIDNGPFELRWQFCGRTWLVQQCCGSTRNA